MANLETILIVSIAFSAIGTIIVSCDDSWQLICEMSELKDDVKESKHQLKVLANESNLLTREQFDELLQMDNSYKLKSCSQNRQNLLDEALEKFSRDEKVLVYLRQVYNWHARHCVNEHKKIVEEIDRYWKETTGNEILTWASQFSAADRKATEEVGNKLGELDSKAALRLLTDASVGGSFEPKLAMELLEKVGRQKESFVLGNVGELIRILRSAYEDEKCSKWADFEKLFARLVKLVNDSSPISQLLIEAAAIQFRKFLSAAKRELGVLEGELALQDVETLREAYEQVRNVRLVGKQTGNLVRVELFGQVIGALQRVAEKKSIGSGGGEPLERFRSSYGQPLLVACKNLESVLERHSKFAGNFFKYSASKELYESREQLERMKLFCKSVPDNQFAGALVRDLNKLDLEWDTGELKKAFKRLDVSEQQVFSGASVEIPIAKLEKVFLKTMDRDYLSNSEKRQIEPEHFTRTFRNLCADSLKLAGFFWLQKAGYKLDARDKELSRVLLYAFTCNQLAKVDSAALVSKWTDKTSLASKLLGKLPCASC